MDLEFHDSFRRALELIERGDSHVFITGKAGTGKSTLLAHFRDITKKNCVVLAPTGVAALNVDGETIHSFFKFKPGIAVEDIKDDPPRRKLAIYKNLQTLIIDEVSMVRADLLDCMDVFLQLARKSKQPFGGVQCVFIGDLYQLPPVVRQDEQEALAERYGSAYFFCADAVRPLFENNEIAFVELDKIFRQKDERFVELLNAVRDRAVTREHLAMINARCKPTGPTAEGPGEADLFLTATNAQADAINQRNLEQLRGFARSYEGLIEGDFPQKNLPTEYQLSLKPGARVMLLNNDPAGRWVNGTLGVVKELHDRVAEVTLDDGKWVTIEAFGWSMFRSVYDKEARVLRQEQIGGFMQLPLRLAWATTIHKSQGKTFDRLTIDLSRGMFAPGQLYVALSRCRTLEGITLTHPLQLSHLMLDHRIVRFLQALRQASRVAAAI